MPSVSKCLVLLCLSAVLLATAGAFAATDASTIAFIRSLGVALGTGWDASADPCGYSGVSCATIDGDTNQVVDLDLSGRGLKGQLPNANGATYMRTIDLSNNNGITGTFPDSWASMIRLTEIDLSTTELTGQIPSGWNGMISLQKAKISHTRACYKLPSWSGTSLTQIREVDLSDNYIYGLTASGFAALASAPQLSSVDISSNPLCGCVDDQWRSNSVMLAAAQKALPSSTEASCFSNAGAKCPNLSKCTANGKTSAAGVVSTIAVAVLAVATMVATVVA